MSLTQVTDILATSSICHEGEGACADAAARPLVSVLCPEAGELYRDADR